MLKSFFSNKEEDSECCDTLFITESKCQVKADLCHQEVLSITENNPECYLTEAITIMN